MSKRTMTILSLIPVACVILEIGLTAMCLRYNSEIGTWVLTFGVFRALSAAGLFLHPYPCLLAELVGLILALKSKNKKFIIAFVIEIILNIVAVIFSIQEFYYAMSI